MFRVIIAGTRTFDNYSLLREYADYKLSKVADSIEIVSGGAQGADALLAYWDGKSRGTKNMIEEARARGLKVGIKLY